MDVLQGNLFVPGAPWNWGLEKSLPSPLPFQGRLFFRGVYCHSFNRVILFETDSFLFSWVLICPSAFPYDEEYRILLSRKKE